ncbi:hypothetical protein RvY_17723 [Ramazzottius varieornatus]|uniref:Uncharacterized protein n=1 Tax=Ramazzottius varieornatus TaxID=947166 RepID=A0A1D1W342_RAMVA|nr:hypothetical protein RvY_17723 [Ramazzottius varieornatus]
MTGVARRNRWKAGAPSCPVLLGTTPRLCATSSLAVSTLPIGEITRPQDAQIRIIRQRSSKTPKFRNQSSSNPNQYSTYFKSDTWYFGTVSTCASFDLRIDFVIFTTTGVSLMLRNPAPLRQTEHIDNMHLWQYMGLFILLGHPMTSDTADIRSCVICSSYRDGYDTQNPNVPDCASNDSAVLQKYITPCSRVLGPEVGPSNTGCFGVFYPPTNDGNVPKVYRSCINYPGFGATFTPAQAQDPSGICFYTNKFNNQPSCTCITADNCNIYSGVQWTSDGKVIAVIPTTTTAPVPPGAGAGGGATVDQTNSGAANAAGNSGAGSAIGNGGTELNGAERPGLPSGSTICVYLQFAVRHHSIITHSGQAGCCPVHAWQPRNGGRQKSGGEKGI